MSSLEKCLFISSALLIGLFGFLLLSCVSCLYILEINPLSVSSFANAFSQSVGYLFVLLVVSFAVQKLVSLIRSYFLFLLSFLLPWEIDLRKHWYDLCQNILPMISSRSFMVSCLKVFNPFSVSFGIWCEGVF